MSSTHPALRAGAGAVHTSPRSDARRPRPPLPARERLERERNRIDELLRDMEFMRPSHRETERQIAEGESIGAAIIAIFRKPAAAVPEPRPVNPPLWQQGGKAIF